MKILMIGAHQNDNEFRCGGLTHKYVKAGHEVQFLCMCDGSGGHHIMTPEETKKRHANECAKVAARFRKQLSSVTEKKREAKCDMPRLFKFVTTAHP